MSLETGITLQIILILTCVAIGAWYWAWTRYLAYKYRHQDEERPAALPAVAAPLLIGKQLAGAGSACAEPPGLAHTLKQLQRDAPNARYRFPIGWNVIEGKALLNRGALVGDTNHQLITAQSDGGKDNLAFGILLSLAILHSPKEVQVCIIDGKGLDFARWEGKAHTWRLAQTPNEIGPAMRSLTAERERRVGILRQAGVSKWESYQGGDLPLLVVYIAELSLLQDVVGKSELESWLNSELAAARAFGIRFILATQTASNFSTRWRSQIGVYHAGFQPRDDQDEPNTGLTTKQIIAAGAVPPSQLPMPPAGAGVFVLAFGRVAVNFRASLITDAERARWLNALPDAPPPELVPAGTGSERAKHADFDGSEELVPNGSRLVLTHTDALEPDQQKILNLASQGWSRNQIASELGGNRKTALNRIRLVLGDAE